ncbi:hypothetical protein GCM10009655_20840 [Rhodoglobus aureus]|uniref:Uncharacterized protein n=1 Tax=Rhodoglobus aureus TaxID=191497 RepID=A0ABN1VVS7_9MICO
MGCESGDYEEGKVCEVGPVGRNDWMLKPTRNGAQLVGLSGTRPGPLLHNSIQVSKAGDEHEKTRVSDKPRTPYQRVPAQGSSPTRKLPSWPERSTRFNLAS